MTPGCMVRLKKIFCVNRMIRSSLPAVAEASYPYVVGVAVGVSGVCSLKWELIPDAICCNCQSFCDGMLVFVSVMSAFTSALFGILFASKDSQFMKVFSKTVQYGTLKRYLFETIIVNLAATFVAICGKSVRFVSESGFLKITLVFLVSSFFIISMLVVVRMVLIVRKLL